MAGMANCMRSHLHGGAQGICQPASSGTAIMRVCCGVPRVVEQGLAGTFRALAAKVKNLCNRRFAEHSPFRNSPAANFVHIFHNGHRQQRDLIRHDQAGRRAAWTRAYPAADSRPGLLPAALTLLWAIRRIEHRRTSHAHRLPPGPDQPEPSSPAPLCPAWCPTDKLPHMSMQVGEVIGRFERKGFKLVGLKLHTPSRALAEEHYADLSSKPFFKDLVNYIISGPVVCMVCEHMGLGKLAHDETDVTLPLRTYLPLSPRSWHLNCGWESSHPDTHSVSTHAAAPCSAVLHAWLHGLPPVRVCPHSRWTRAILRWQLRQSR